LHFFPNVVMPLAASETAKPRWRGQFYAIASVFAPVRAAIFPVLRLSENPLAVILMCRRRKGPRVGEVVGARAARCRSSQRRRRAVN